MLAATGEFNEMLIGEDHFGFGGDARSAGTTKQGIT